MSAVSTRVNGNTILEVVVALIIISASIGLTGTFFSSVFNTSSRMIKQQAWYDINEQINHIKHHITAEPLEIDRGHYLLRIEVDIMDEEMGLAYVTVYGIDNKGMQLVERRFFFELEAAE
ncbi:PulJ/GspJ family protein [Geofilum rubicundum]|uniref:Type II secretion system protein n=1 Tax=Geofilum rubicundum JCM 15548 TaxID=1236989 RepID=A0A0E9M453_9BACT|nr:hypothetical protein [Geofilum rubicundum]GAO31955.1 hypothetical protein JCM15548_14370 [Geofilum rubicundum JCM 15548]